MWKLKFRSMKQIGRWISRKVETGTQAFKVQHPLFPLPMKHKLTNGSLRSQQWAGSQPCLDYLWLQPFTSSMRAAFLTPFVPGPHSADSAGQRPSHTGAAHPVPIPPRQRVCHSCSCQWVSEWKVLSHSLWPHRLYNPWNSPGQNTGVCRLSLLQGIFPTQGSNSGLLHCRQTFTSWATKENP